MAGKKKPGIPVKGINIKLRMINDLIDVTGSAKDSWNPAEISDDMKAIAYIHDLADTWNPAQLNEALKYLGFKTVDTWNPAELEETKNKLVRYFLPTDASGNPIELDLKGSLPYEVTALTITLLPKQSGTGDPAPDNVRPITGRDSVTLTVNGDDIETTFENTVYGGTLDLITGKLTIYKKYIDLSTLSWEYVALDRWQSEQVVDITNPSSTSTSTDTICDTYKAVSITTLNADETLIAFSVFGNRIYVRNGDDFNTPTGNICYTLNTPIEVTLTPEEITLINGENTLSTDGDTINITYKAILNS